MEGIMITVGSMVKNMQGAFQLQKSQQALFDASSKLTSGKRINSAKDDPAGLAIANLLTSQIRENNQSIRNANDGISLTQVADGALSGANDVLQRIRELAVQAGNGTLNDSNRDNIQAEINQLTDQLSDIGENTKFNGLNVFENKSSLNIQVGFNQSISLELGGLSANSLTSGLNAASGDLEGGRVDPAATGVSAGSISVNGVELGALGASTSGQADVKAELVNQVSGQTGVIATASNVIQGGSVNANQPVTQGINVTVDGNTTTLGSSANLNDFVKDFNLNVAGAEAKIGSDGSLQIYNDTGKDIVLADNAVGGLGSLGLSTGNYSGSISLSSSDGSDISIATTDTGNMEDLKAFGFNQQQGASALSGGQVTGQSISDADGIEINGVALGAVGTTGSAINAGDISQAINDISDETGVTANANTQVELSADISALQNNNLSINGIAVFSGFTGNSLGDVINQVNSAGIGDITASSNSAGELVLNSNSGQDINIDNGATAFSQSGSAINNSFSQRGELSLSSSDGSEINISSNADISSQGTAVSKLGLSDVGGFSSNTGGNVATVENSGDLISSIDNLINQVSEARSSLGATQSRFISTINNLSDAMLQSESSRSQIQDADYARSISEFLQARLSQEIGTNIFVKSQESERNFISKLIAG
jgi:flagellin